METKEKNLEEAIEYWLDTEGGWTKGYSKDYNPALGLIPDDLLKFIQDTQPKAWKRYEAAVVVNPKEKFLESFTKTLARNETNILDVLRYGFKTRGITFRLVYWKPETDLNPDTETLYDQNIMHCVRQLYYSSKNENSLDMALFVNGLPLVTMELKNQFTGQSIADGKHQYRTDRNPNELIFQFRKRSLAHFAVDLYEAAMTTRLEGPKTWFSPFNQGSNGAGNVGGAGNPQNPNGFQTDYLWKTVLCKDVLLEIFHKYMLYDKKKDRMIFPRYHQLDVVTKLIADVKKRGAGRNYLIQHSAGSGKSNSIAWLAYRLSGLHNDKDEKIFKSVIVVTDRRVLDSQLQDTIFQFDHVPGVVEKIDKDSKQLRDAINSGKKIIITTLQKFPVVYQEIHGGHNNFAIIVDEAHSSQTGTAAKKLKRALADTQSILEEYARLEQEEEAGSKDDEDRMLDELAAQGQQKNLSFFAFTATPKGKTLQLFGDLQPDGSYKAFHIYSMRQAIEEGYILDVLKNYVTYRMYYKILKKTPEDPELDNAQAIAAIKRYETLHPHNIAQKTEIIMDHFNRITRYKIGGKAKAMIVTASRLHAVRYLFAIRQYIKDHNMDGVDVLVAFSGEVEDHGETYTEPGLNHTKDGDSISEKALPEVFKGDDFNLLVVAEKYQTGFDEPLLHTMFVDKKLDGVKAVQTLSRLNRTYPGKTDTFVLDFVNTAEDIQEAFQPYYEATILEEGTDPDIVYSMKTKLDEYAVYGPEDIEKVSKLFYSTSEDKGNLKMGQLSGLLMPCVQRYKNLPNKDDRDLFRTLMARFDRVYSFVTQIARMFDRELQAYSIFVKFLLKVLPKNMVAPVDIENLLNLEYYKLKQDFAGSIALESQSGTVKPISGGDGSTFNDEKKKLQEILDKVNQRHETNFTDQDKVFSQFESDFMKDEKAANFAKNNDEEMFYKGYFKDKFMEVMYNRFKENSDFAKTVMNSQEDIEDIVKGMLPIIYNKLRSQ